VATFTPPARSTAVPPILPYDGPDQSPAGRLLFRHYRGRPEGINVFLLSNGTITEEDPDSENTFWERGDGQPYVMTAWYGGHDDYNVTDYEAALLQAAGYTVVDSTPPAPTPPVITSLSPSSGSAGTVVSIFGTNLAEVTVLSFDGDSTPFTVVSSTLIRFTAPDVNGDDYEVLVFNAYGNSDTLTFTLTEVIPDAPPDITIVPPSGLAGSAIEIIGSGLATVTTVSFNGSPVSFESFGDSLIRINAPVLAAGEYTISVESAFGSDSATFTITEVAGPGDPHPGADILLETSDFLLLEDGTSSLLQES
jgi:hypothetical protein